MACGRHQSNSTDLPPSPSNWTPRLRVSTIDYTAYLLWESLCRKRSNLRSSTDGSSHVGNRLCDSVYIPVLPVGELRITRIQRFLKQAVIPDLQVGFSFRHTGPQIWFTTQFVRILVRRVCSKQNRIPLSKKNPGKIHSSSVASSHHATSGAKMFMCPKNIDDYASQISL